MGIRFAAGLVLAGSTITVALAPSAVRADCDGPYPSFVESAPSARQVVIGDVVAVEGTDWIGSEGRTSRFWIKAWSLDGTGPVALAVRDLVSQPCAGLLFAGVGDRVAIAFDGRAFANNVPVNAIAWIDGPSPEVVGIETLTVADVFQAVGLPVPATFPPEAAPAPGSDSPWLPLAAVVALLLVGGAVLGRLLVRGES